ncbi:hypothetical protein GMMP1_60023 [Candidatus Magnetomoraceae bacterium gMMP-1]
MKIAKEVILLTKGRYKFISCVMKYLNNKSTAEDLSGGDDEFSEIWL